MNRKAFLLLLFLGIGLIVGCSRSEYKEFVGLEYYDALFGEDADNLLDQYESSYDAYGETADYDYKYAIFWDERSAIAFEGRAEPGGQLMITGVYKYSKARNTYDIVGEDADWLANSGYFDDWGEKFNAVGTYSTQSGGFIRSVFVNDREVVLLFVSYWRKTVTDVVRYTR